MAIVSVSLVAATILPGPREQPLKLAFYYVWYKGEPYDSSDPAVLRSHVQNAKAMGFDGFIVSLWGDNLTERNADILAEVIDDEGDFYFAILVEMHGIFTEESEAISYILARFSWYKSYLQWKGNPVVAIYNPIFEMVTDLENRTDVSIWLISPVHSLQQFEVIDERQRAIEPQSRERPAILGYRSIAHIGTCGFDVVAYYNPLTDDMTFPTGRYRASTIIYNFNNSAVTNQAYMVSEEGIGPVYEQDALGADIILVTSFNEYPEGTAVFP